MFMNNHDQGCSENLTAERFKTKTIIIRLNSEKFQNRYFQKISFQLLIGVSSSTAVQREILSFNLYENLEIFEIIFGIFEISLIFGGSVNWGQVSIKLSIRPLQVSGWPLVRFLTLSFDFFTFSKLVSKFFLKF